MHERALLVATALVLTATLGAVAQGPVLPSVATEGEPYDPETGGTVGEVRVVTEADGRRVVLTGPLKVRSQQGVIDGVVVHAPDGRALASLACADGACAATLPGERLELPAGTLIVDGAWRSGRPTGARLVGPEGGPIAALALFGPAGVTVSSPLLPAPLTVLPRLVLEGDPRDPDGARVLDAEGRPALSFTAGGPGVGEATLAGVRLAVDQVRLALEGDPLSGEPWLLVVRLDGEAVRIEGPVPEAVPLLWAGTENDLVRLHRPTGLSRPELILGAGPVVLEGPGTLSPRFDLRIRVAIATGEGIDRGTAATPSATVSLTPAGRKGGDTVLLGTVPAWALGATHGETTGLELRFERDLAPGIVQVLDGGEVPLVLDTEGPAPPQLRYEPGRLTWPPPGEPVTLRVELAWEDGPFRPLPHQASEAALPTAPPGTWSARARATDAVGNPGAWSGPVSWTVPARGLGATGPPRWTVEAPPGPLAGPIPFAWTPDPTVALVRGEVSGDGGSTWTRIGASPVPPLAWETRLFPDGTYLVRLTAEGPGGSDAVLLGPLAVDNLAPLEAAGAGAPAAGGTGVPPAATGPVSPLPVALSLAMVLASGVLLGLFLVRSRRRRDK